MTPKEKLQELIDKCVDLETVFLIIKDAIEHYAFVEVDVEECNFWVKVKEEFFK